MWTAFRFSLLMLLIGGLLYPLAIAGLGQFLFSAQANGSLIYSASSHTTPIGSRLIAQAFTRPDYFHPRPSANSYDGANSGGSNLGPTNQKLINRVEEAAAAYRKETPGQTASAQSIPMDALTTSASSLDPHISLPNAFTQAERVALARKTNVASIRHLIAQLSEKPFLAESSYINVLKLNLALDTLTGKAKEASR